MSSEAIDCELVQSEVVVESEQLDNQLILKYYTYLSRTGKGVPPTAQSVDCLHPRILIASATSNLAILVDLLKMWYL